LGHTYPQARLRYWRAADKTVWILDEIGKEYPITAAFVVVDQQIERAQVLIYRESRGEEIHLPAFLRQFIGGHLDGERLSNKIDGITGATLSVRAMERMARAALVLNQLAVPQSAP
jgi:FMN-binding domain